MNNSVNLENTVSKILKGIHAREWISYSVATYLIRQLVDPDNKRYLDSFMFHIVPCANPDGYEHTRTTDRYWRKNRRENRDCYGVDLNRNFGYKWGDSGVSFDPCSNVYAGPAPFSEPETLALKEYFDSLYPVPIMTLSLHSFGQWLIYPYAYKNGTYPENIREIRRMCYFFGNAIMSVHGKEFKCISIADTLCEFF